MGWISDGERRVLDRADALGSVDEQGPSVCGKLEMKRDRKESSRCKELVEPRRSPNPLMVWSGGKESHRLYACCKLVFS